eukprot:gene31153-6295_t
METGLRETMNQAMNGLDDPQEVGLPDPSFRCELCPFVGKTARGIGRHKSSKHPTAFPKASPAPELPLGFDFPWTLQMDPHPPAESRNCLVSMKQEKGLSRDWPSKIVKIFPSERTENISLDDLKHAIGLVKIFSHYDETQIYERMKGKSSDHPLVSSDEDLLDAMRRASGPNDLLKIVLMPKPIEVEPSQEPATKKSKTGPKAHQAALKTTRGIPIHKKCSRAGTPPGLPWSIAETVLSLGL